MTTGPTVLVTPRRPALVSGFDNTVDLLVRVQAPPRPETLAERKPLNLAVVLDRSGSMSGPPLDEARRCAAMIVDRLEPRDRAALVVYDDAVRVLVPATPAADRAVFHQAIAAITEGGTTNLYGGWLAGNEQMIPLARGAATTRVLLLSDGQANSGITNPDAITRQCAERADAGITTSTYGLGRHFNEELMIGLANAGRGNSYYGETAEDLMDPFAEEFDLLAGLCAREIFHEAGPPRHRLGRRAQPLRRRRRRRLAPARPRLRGGKLGAHPAHGAEGPCRRRRRLDCDARDRRDRLP